jgi:hypothetical protein
MTAGTGSGSKAISRSYRSGISSSGDRSGRRDARSRLLDPRRHHAATPDGRRRASRHGAPLQAARHDPLAALRALVRPEAAGYTSYKMTGPVTVSYRGQETPQGTTVQNVPRRRAEPARRRDHPLHPARECAGEGDPAHPRRRGQRGPRLQRQGRPDGQAGGGPPTSGEAPAVARRKRRSRRDRDRRGGRGGDGRPGRPGPPGANRFVWDLRYAAPTPLSMRAGSARPASRRWTTGSRRRPAPGTYTVELTVGGETLTQEFTLLKDPRSTRARKSALAVRAENSPSATASRRSTRG